MNRITVFLREVRVEMGKVSWPTRSQLLTYTGVVIGLSVFVALYLGGLNAVFSSALNRLVVR